MRFLGSQKTQMFLHAESEDSDQTGRMTRLTWVFAGRTDHFVGFVVRRPICNLGESNERVLCAFSKFKNIFFFLHDFSISTF